MPPLSCVLACHVSKRSRSDRRAHQGERAVVIGDVEALRALAEKGTSAAVPAFVRALGTPPADPAQAAELDALALRLAKQLRRAGEPAHALDLAAAGRRRTPAWCMEEALAAFASGRDEVAADVASADEAVAHALGPLLQAAHGEVATASSAASGLRTLHAAARAVGHIVRGEPDQAKAVVRRIPVADRGSALVNEISAAADLLVPARALAALALLHAAPGVTADARRAMTSEAILDADALDHLPRALGGDPVLGRRILRARLDQAKSPGAVAEIIRRVGPEAFDAPDRGSAALYHGFSLLRTDPPTASRSFDRAVQLGADLLEALRGKMLATLGAAMTCPKFARDAERAMRDAASAADRLAHALARVPLGGPLAAAAGEMAAERWIDARDGRHALAAIARARPLAGGKLLDELALKEADSIAFESMSEAVRLVDTLLARSPGYVKAWKLKSEFALARGEITRAEAILVEAAAATKDPELLETAREIQGRRGELVAFSGLVPGAVSAGALARELARATTSENDAYPLAAAHRKELGPAARLAFDGAAIAIAEHFGTRDMAEKRLAELVPIWQRAPGDVACLVGAALHAGLADAIPRATIGIDKDAAAMRAIIEVLAIAGERRLVKVMLPKIATSLTRHEISLFKAVVEGKKRVTFPGVPSPDEAVSELDRALAPEFSIANAERLVAEMRRPSGPRGPRDDADDALAGVFDQLGLPSEALLSLSKEALRRLEKRIFEIMSGPQTPAAMMELMGLLSELGLGPAASSGRRPRKKR